MLKIKEGVTLHPYGPSSILTSESQISQEALEHLKTRYPEDIEGDIEQAPNRDDKGDDKGADVKPTYTKAQMLEMVKRVKEGTATQIERDAVAEARTAGKL